MNKIISIFTLLLLLYILPGCINSYRYQNVEVSLRNFKTNEVVKNIKIRSLCFVWAWETNLPKEECVTTDSYGNARMAIPLGYPSIHLWVPMDKGSDSRYSYEINDKTEKELKNNGWVVIDDDAHYYKYYIILKQIDTQENFKDIRITIQIPLPPNGLL